MVYSCGKGSRGGKVCHNRHVHCRLFPYCPGTGHRWTSPKRRAGIRRLCSNPSRRGAGRRA